MQVLCWLESRHHCAIHTLSLPFYVSEEGHTISLVVSPIALHAVVLFVWSLQYTMEKKELYCAPRHRIAILQMFWICLC